MFSLDVHHTKRQTVSNPPYMQSEINAIVAGFIEVKDKCAYNGRYFIKNGKKWIHNLEALRKKLNSEYGRILMMKNCLQLLRKGLVMMLRPIIYITQNHQFITLNFLIVFIN